MCTAIRRRTYSVEPKNAKNASPIYPYYSQKLRGRRSLRTIQFQHWQYLQGLISCQLIVGLVASTSYMGDYGINLFYLYDYNCSSEGFYLFLSLSTFTTQLYDANQYVNCYRALAFFRKHINFNRNDYVKGYCSYMLEIDPYYSSISTEKDTAD